MRYLYFLPLILALVSTAFAADRASYGLTVYSADSSRSRYRGTFSFSIDQQEDGKTYYNRQKKDFDNWSSYLVIEGVAPEASGSFTLSVPGVLSLPAGPDQHVTLETSWTNEGTYEKDLQIVITYIAGDIEDDPDPEEPGDTTAKVQYEAEADPITNNGVADQQYIGQITFEDGTIDYWSFTVRPGETFWLTGGKQDQPYALSVWQEGPEGNPVKVADYDSTTILVDSDIPPGPTSPTKTDQDGNTTTPLDPPQQPRTGENDDNAEARHREDVDQRKQIADAQIAQLKRIRKAVADGNGTLDEISDKIGNDGDGTDSPLPDLPDVPEFDMESLTGLDHVDDMINSVIGKIPSVNSFPTVTGRKYVYDFEPIDFMGETLDFSFDLTKIKEPIELIRLLEEALVIIMFAISCAYLIKGGFA